MNPTTTPGATTARPPGAASGRFAPRSGLGPPLVLPALMFALLSLAGIALAASPPLPTASAAEVLAYYREHQQSATLLAFLQFGASIPLAIFAATAFSRLRGLGLDVPGAAIGLVGGVLATA